MKIKLSRVVKYFTEWKWAFWGNRGYKPWDNSQTNPESVGGGIMGAIKNLLLLLDEVTEDRDRSDYMLTKMLLDHPLTADEELIFKTIKERN